MTTILITPHATRAYCERVCPGLPAARAEAEIREALARPLFGLSCASGELCLFGCVNRAGFPFLAACDPPGGAPAFLLVRTVGAAWFWHEARPLWREHGINPHRPSAARAL